MKLFSAIVCLIALFCQIGIGVVGTCDSCRHYESPVAQSEPSQLGCACAHEHGHESLAAISHHEIADGEHQHIVVSTHKPHKHTPCHCSDVTYTPEIVSTLNGSFQHGTHCHQSVSVVAMARCDVITASSAPPHCHDALSPDSGSFYAIQYGAFLL